VSGGGLGFRSSDGLSIEGALDAPPQPTGALVLCHPHPSMGGTMNAPLLLALRDALVPRGWAVLRFNFRGIGGSEGSPGTGEDEVGDAEGAVVEARRRVPTVPVAIGGWSFGGAVAVRAAERDDSLAGCAAIAPAVRTRPGVTVGLPPADQLDLGVPLLFVCGANDRVVAPEDCKRWIDDVPAGLYVEIGAANHFFWGRYEALGAVVGDWLDGLVRPQGGR
jgi:alpha/beta superfamily hydrolase